MEKKNKKIIIVVSIIVLFLVLSGVIYFIYQSINKDNDTEILTNSLTINLNNNGGICEEQEECNEFVIKTANSDAKYINIDSLLKRFILYQDGNLKIYDIYTKEITKLDLEVNPENEYRILVNSELTKPTGVLYFYHDMNNAKIDYYLYDLETNNNEKISSTNDGIIYNNFVFDGKYLSKTIIVGRDSNKYLMLNLPAKKDMISINEFQGSMECGEITSNVLKSKDNYYFYVACTSSSSPYYKKVYNETGKLIIDMNDYEPDKTKPSYYYLSVEDGYLYVANENTILKYNNNGEEVDRITTYSKIIDLVNDYVFYLDKDNMLTIGNLNTKSSHKLLDYSKYSDLIIDSYLKNTTYRRFKEDETGIYFSLLKIGENIYGSDEYYYNPQTDELKKIN